VRERGAPSLSSAVSEREQRGEHDAAAAPDTRGM
jgi:hypothetical protein